MDRSQPLLAELLAGLAAEDAARAALRTAVHRQAVALAELRRQGMPASLVAVKLTRARGEALPLSDRLRLAERLRKRRWRGTRRPVEVAAAHGHRPSAIALSIRAMMPEDGESDMAKLVKRTVTEEYIEREDEAFGDEEELEAEEHDEQEEEDEDQPRSPTRRKKR